MSEGHKDVLYIDVEDDITSIIGKVKASKHKVIALVPPKRIGVLQSAVNLRLLARAAKQDEKHLVLITNNHALLTLAAAAALPVAKNLQTKPELAEAPVAEEETGEEDIINGEELPVGEHAKQTKPDSETDDTSDEAIAAGLAAATAKESAKTAAATGKKGKKSPSVPNFDTFRKKLFFGLSAGILLISFLVWALVFAPRATVVISAKTTSSSVNVPVKVGADVKTDFAKSTLAAATQTQQTPKTVEFAPTGQKDVGTKATGTVKLAAQSLTGVSMAAGTPLQSSSGLTFTTDTAVSVPASSFGPGCFPTACPGTATVSVTAAENGSKYNAASGAVSGTPSSVSGNFTGPTSGGVSRMVTVVTKADVDKAKESLSTQNVEAIKAELKGKFTDGAVAIDQSFAVDYTDISTTPAVDAEVAGGKATLTAKVTYKMYGVAKQDLKTFIEAYVMKDTNGLKDQRIYDDGTSKALFQEVAKTPSGAKATLIATAAVGPKINDDAVREQVKGKRYGEVQQTLQSIQGVESVDVKYFPFWVSSVPSDNNKITIEFKLNGAK